jgi:alpha-beta hydrolase superfamily lysophospholipase
MNNLKDAATISEDGCILIGQTVTCDGFASERSIRIQTSINRLNNFSTSKGQQKKIVLSQETYNELLKQSSDIKFRREQFEIIPVDGVYHTVENTQICFFPSGEIAGGVIPVITTENGTAVMYSPDISLSQSLSELCVPKVDVLVVDVKSVSIDAESDDFSSILSLIKTVKPKLVITYSLQSRNTSLLNKYIKDELGIESICANNSIGLDGKDPDEMDKAITTKSGYTSESIKCTSLKKYLIVIVCAENQKAESWNPLVNELKKEIKLAESEWLIWDKHNLHNKSFQDGFSLSIDLKAKIDARWKNDESFEEVILIGHSLGGILVRQAYLLASGTYKNRGYDRSPWYEYVRRLVLFASPNRGLDPKRSLIWQMAIVFEKTTSFSLRKFVPLHNFAKGSAFISNLRIDWIRHFSSESYYPLIVIQILGTKNGTITRNDSIDLEQFPDAFHVDIPDVENSNIHEIDLAEDREERYKIIKRAILNDNLSGLSSDKNSNLEPSIAKNNVVFILHGIRASNNGWVAQMREKIYQEDPNTEVITSSYDYFSAFNFILPGLRQINIDWFQDEYSYYFAKYPNTDFHFIGHSNGTYILGESLKRLPGMQFKRVYLAGSVLPRDYPWRDRCDRLQVEKLCNARSSFDWPVGILCNGLRGVGMRDIGTGGFDGFLFGEKRLKELYYFDGDHGKPLEETYQDLVIKYILTGNIGKPEGLKSEEDIKKFQLFSRAAPSLARTALIIVIAIDCFLIFVDFSISKLLITLAVNILIAIVTRVALIII